MNIENDGEPPCGRYTILTDEEISLFREAFGDIGDLSQFEQITFFPENFADKAKVNSFIREYDTIKSIAQSKTTLLSPNLKLSGEFFPTDVAPVVRASETPGRMDSEPMKWGFLPSWGTPSRVLINATCESVTTAKAFAESVVNRRCLIPTMGYFEWKSIEGEKKKVKHYIITKGAQLMYLAGIYKQFTDPKTGELTLYFCIMTRTTAPEIEDIHGRMPLVIPRPNAMQWLHCGNTPEAVNEFINDLSLPEMLAKAI